MNYFLTALTCAMLCCLAGTTHAQESWSSTDTIPEPGFISTRIVNQHSVETLDKGFLDFRISHRFGPMNSGAYNGFGIDGGASIRFGLEYGITKKLMVGLGHSNVGKMEDGFIKYKLLSQGTGRTPVSLTFLGGVYKTSMKDPNKDATGFDKYGHYYQRFSYAAEVIAARKINDHLALQIAPWFVHYNMVDQITDLNDMYGFAGGIRIKLNKTFGIIADYSMALNTYSRKDYYNALGVGVEIETGGHRFEVILTNAYGLDENQFLPYTENKWKDGGIRIGFNISRLFNVNKK